MAHANGQPGFGVAEHAVLFGIDGLSIRALHAAIDSGAAPALKALRNRGIFTDDARSMMPSDSLPNWASALFSAPPEMHGIHTKSLDDDVRPATYPTGALYPNLFTAGRAQRPSLTTAAYFSWPRLKQLLPPESMNSTVVLPCQGCDACMRSEPALTDAFLSELRRARGPSLSFFYLDMLDECGHTVGDGSATYEKAVSIVDAQLARILHALRQAGRIERTLIVVASDHGRDAAGRHHGGFTTSELAFQVCERARPRTFGLAHPPPDHPCHAS